MMQHLQYQQIVRTATQLGGVLRRQHAGRYVKRNETHNSEDKDVSAKRTSSYRCCRKDKRDWFRMKRAQSTLEYAVLIAIVATAIAAMHTYVQRSVQANLKMIEQQVNAEMVEEEE